MVSKIEQDPIDLTTVLGIQIWSPCTSPFVPLSCTSPSRMASSTTTASDDSGGAPPAAHPATLRSVSFEAAAGVAKHMEAGTPGSESVTSSSKLRRARMLDSALGGGGFASTRHLLSSKTSLGGDGWGSSSQQFRGERPCCIPLLGAPVLTRRDLQLATCNLQLALI